MRDYTIYYKTTLPLDDGWGAEHSWDLFLSAYVPTDRAKKVHDLVSATEKKWVIFPEYEYAAEEHPAGDVFVSGHNQERDFIEELLRPWQSNLSTLRVCVDITGFVRPHLMFLMRWFCNLGVRSFDALYAEPVKYAKREETQFSGEVIEEVRQVAGFEGVHDPDMSSDVVIIGVGYEDRLIARVAEEKAKAAKLQLFGFPPLKADMYQESVLRVKEAEESLGQPADDQSHTFFAPANDPFVVATVLSQIAADLRERDALSNLYLCPLATKAQVLGFSLFYLHECMGTATSIIFPFESACRRNTSQGVSRIWKYTIELPNP